MGKVKDMAMELEEELRASKSNELAQVKTVSPSVSVERGLTALTGLDAAAIDTLARAKVNEVAEGHLDAAKLFALGQKISLLGTTIVDNIKGYVYGKTYATKGETYTIDGVELTPSALGTKYAYDKTGDPEWELLNAIFENAKKAKESREKFLKALSEPLQFVDKDGVGHTIQPPVKTEINGYKSKVK